MPRRDRTYTGTDLVRFFARNLEPTEQRDVLVVMAVAIALGSVREVRSKLLLAIIHIAVLFIPQPYKQIAKILLRFFRVKSFAEEANQFLERAERVSRDAGLTLGDLNEIIDRTENL